MRTLVLVDGEHYVPVVRAAIERLPTRIQHCQVVGAAFLGGAEKLASRTKPDLGVPLVSGEDVDCALLEGLRRFEPQLVVDLSDEPVLDSRQRLRLVARTLAAGVAYRGADFRFDPPPRPSIATKPAVAIIGTGKRAGKTAVSAHLGRLLAARGTAPAIVTMGRGGPDQPEVIDPSTFDLSPLGLLRLVHQGRHAASDHFEDALMAGVVTVGTRRCGGGLAGAPGDDTFAAGVELANRRPERVLLLEGSGSAIPPVQAHATICLVPAADSSDLELLVGYLGAYRLLLADLIVIIMSATSLAVSGARSDLEVVQSSVRRLAPGAQVVVATLRPVPLGQISGRRVFYATTASAPVAVVLAQYLESEHDCRVVGISSHLADRQRLSIDLVEMGAAEVLVVELKAAAVDLAARLALERGLEVVFCDNRVVSVDDDVGFDELALATVDLAWKRFHSMTAQS